jgi:mannose-6-phosphate isomerase-like protein (cupin superfamily)
MSAYTVRNLRDSEDFAPKFGYADVQEARFPWRDLDAERTGIAHLVVKPGRRQAFAHRHRNAEEVYVVLAGAGRVKLDDDVVEVGRLDAIRVSPPVARAFEAGPEGLELLAFSTRHEGDAEIVRDDFWAG